LKFYKNLFGSKKGLNPQSFVEVALDFERSKTSDLKASRNAAWMIASVLAIIAVLTTISMTVAIFKRTEPEPTVIVVDKNTGVSSVMRKVSDAEDHFDEVVDKHSLSEYIKYRESYDWYEIGSSYAVVKLMSSDNIGKEYSSEVYAKNAPLNIYKDNAKVRVHVVSVAFVGSLGQVRFTTEKVNSSGKNMDGSPLQNWVSTIGYNYDVARKMTDQERIANPLGFEVVSYRKDAEASN
jgi:type IV secretion system protein VirB8